jgi:hypothetical protein
MRRTAPARLATLNGREARLALVKRGCPVVATGGPGWLLQVQAVGESAAVASLAVTGLFDG